MQSSAERGSTARLDVERVELSNGIVLLLSENHTTPLVSINAIVRTGSRFESDDSAGLASLVGELLDEGTSTRTGQQIAETVESVGGRMVTFGDYQLSGIASAFLAKDIELGLGVIADILTNAVFPENKVALHIERRIAQIKSRLDVPRTKASDLFNEIVFKGTPQHRPAFGYEETVKKLSQRDVVEYYNRFYTPGNTLFVVVGDINKGDVIGQLEKALGQWSRPAEFHAPQPPPPSPGGAPVEKFVTVPKEQVNIYTGHAGIKRTNPDYYALLVLDTILGSSPGFTSRIPRILRDEMGLAYTTFANITSSAGLDPGRFVAYIGTSPDNLDRALAGLRNEIERIVRDPVSEQELEVAKSYLTGSFVFHFQKNAQIADFLVEAEIYGLGYDYIERFPEIISATDVEDITRVAREHLHPGQLVTVVVGPVDEQGRLLK